MIQNIKTHPKKDVYGVYLNTDQFGKWKPEVLNHMVHSRNSNWKNLDITFKESFYLKVAVSSTFLDLVVKMLNDGLIPSYVDFSFWIARYKTIKQSYNKEYLVNQIEMMFIDLIKRGFRIDLYYLDEIGLIDPRFRLTLFEEYQKPLYMKVCSKTEDGYIPDKIKGVSVFFGVPEGINKTNFCESIHSITQAQSNSLIEANNRRVKDAILSKVNLLSDYINNSRFEGCSNTASFEEHPFSYPLDLLAYYKDDEGHTWCFLSNNFESLLHKKINPSSKKELPEEFINRLTQQTELLKHFKIPLSNPKTISKIIADLKKNEVPNNVETDEIVSRVRMLLETKDISEDYIIKKMKISEIVKRFKKIGVDIQDILLLSDSELEKTIDTSETEFSPKIIYNLICYCLHQELSFNIEKLSLFLNP